MKPSDTYETVRPWIELAAINLRFGLRGGYLLPGHHHLQGPNRITGDFFGICVAPNVSPDGDPWIVERLLELGIRHVRLDFTPESFDRPAGRLLRFLLKNDFAICLHLVQPLAEAELMTTDPAAMERWRNFVRKVVNDYGAELEMVEIGSTPNRRKWAGHSLRGFRIAWKIAHEAASQAGLTIAAPNVTDFEPVYNLGLLDFARREGILPHVHSDNLFAERATEPEAYDPKILGPRLTGLHKFNTVKKAALLQRIGRRFAIERTMSMHVAWSARRIRRILADSDEKQADYLQRYLCLLAASGHIERAYWGPMIGQREGIIDDGTDVYPDLPHVTLYIEALGNPADYRLRPAFHALRATVRQLAGWSFVRDHSRIRDLRILEFTRGESLRHVLWTTNGNAFDPRQWYDPVALQNAEVTDRNGTPCAALSCLVGESPVFLLWKKTKPASFPSPPRLLPQVRLFTSPQHKYCPVSRKNLSGIMVQENDPPLEAETLISLLPEGSRQKITCGRKDGITRQVVETAVRGIRNRLDITRYPVVTGYRKTIQKAPRTAPGRSAWNSACEMLRRGIATPQPVAYFETVHGKRKSNYYLCAHIPGDGSLADLYSAMRSGKTSFAGLHVDKWMNGLGNFLNHAHLRGCRFKGTLPEDILLRREADGEPAFACRAHPDMRFAHHALPQKHRRNDRGRLCLEKR